MLRFVVTPTDGRAQGCDILEIRSKNFKMTKRKHNKLLQISSSTVITTHKYDQFNNQTEYICEYT